MRNIWNKFCDWWSSRADIWAKVGVILIAILLLLLCWEYIVAIVAFVFTIAFAVIAMFWWVFAIIICVKHSDRKRQREEKERELAAAIEHERRTNEYNNSLYRQQTHNTFEQVLNDDGKWQEYLIATHLESFVAWGCKLLCNAYVPLYDGTTEIDLILIAPTGVYLYESKNYGGYIGGDENQETWCQVCNGHHKEYFYNPVKQNQTHMKALAAVLPYQVPMHSVVVFADRCKIDKVSVNDNSADIIYVSQAKCPIQYDAERAPHVLSPDEITEIYASLYPYTQVSDEVKREHIQQVQRYRR